MKQKGFSLIELMVVIAILGLIGALVALNISDFFEIAGNETATNTFTVINATVKNELSNKPISTLNLTELQSLVDWYSLHGHPDWAKVYQNQIIILKLEANQ